MYQRKWIPSNTSNFYLLFDEESNDVPYPGKKNLGPYTNKTVY